MATIETEFRFDKRKLVPAFKEYIDQYTSDDEKEFQPKNAKEVTVSKLEILRKVQNVYEWVLKESLLDIRQMYVHDDKKFEEVKNHIKSYIKNKIRSTSDGQVYLKVGDFMSFTGDKEQYEEWIVNSRRNQERIVRKVIDDLNSFLENGEKEDGNKPILNDSEFVKTVQLTNEDIVQYIFDKMDQKLVEQFVESSNNKDVECSIDFYYNLSNILVKEFNCSDKELTDIANNLKQLSEKLSGKDKTESS